MKKLCTKSAGIDLKFSRFPFIKVLSLTSIAALLSSVSPVFSKNLDSKEEISTNIKNVAVAYPKSVISAYDTSTGYLEPFDVSKDNYVTVLNTALTQKVSASTDDSDYANFLASTFSDVSNDSVVVNAFRADGSNRSKRAINANIEGKKKQSIITPQLFVRNNVLSPQFNQNGEDADIINVSNIRTSDSSQAMPREVSGSNVILGNNTNTRISDAVVIGYKAEAVLTSNTTTNLGWGVVIGAHAKVHRGSTVAIGNDTIITKDAVQATVVGRYARAEQQGALGLGFGANASGEDSIAVGRLAQAKVKGAIAIGSFLPEDDITNPTDPNSDPNKEIKRTNALGKNSIAIGVLAKSENEDAVSIGSEAFALAKRSVAIGALAKSEMENAVSIGAQASALGEKSIAIGFGAKSDNTNAVSIGAEASAYKDKSIALGLKSQAMVDTGVSIGAYSVANVSGGAGYSPFLGHESEDPDSVWTSTLGAVSVGNISGGKSRQITGVAAGKRDADAVNVAQLKSLRDYVDKGWKLSVNGKNSKVVAIDDSINLAAGSSNFEITKGTDDNNIKFDLAKNITLGSVTAGDSIKAGTNILDTAGLKIADGPQITAEGMNAAGKKIKGVAEGTDATDAVNFGQLQKIEKQVAASSFVKQDDKTKYITIGKDTDGDKIDIINKTGGARTLSGVKAGTAETDAVNFAQLQKVEKEIKEQVATSSFVKQNAETKHITIGKDTDGDKIDIANNKSEKRILTGIKGGDISKDSSEAVIGSQLFTTNQTLVTYFGGGAEYKDGKWKEPTFTFKTVKEDGEEKDETYHNVAEALTGVGTSFTNVQNKITNEIINQINNAITKVEGKSFIQQDKEKNRLTIGAKTEGTEINVANKSGVNRVISGVADAKNNNDAVNKGQLDNSIKSVTDQLTNITQQVQGDSLLWSASDGAFVAQHGEEKAKSKLKFLLNGDITVDSTDAINGSQLYSMSNNLAAYFSDGAGYDKNGEWKAPTFKVNTVKEDGTAGEESYDTVEKAFSAVGTSFTNIQNTITNEITKEINKTKGDALLWSESDRAFVAQHGEEKTNSKISFLANGDITVDSMDAINGSQLYAVINSLSGYFGGGAEYKDGQWKEPTFYVSQFKKDGNGDSKKDYHDVAAAFEGVNGSLSSINERINNVAKDVSSSGLNWNETEKAYDASHNGTPSKIKHVENGSVSKGSTDAVNGGQLFETNNRVEKVEKSVENINQKVENIENTVMNDAVKYDKNDKGDKINKVTLAGVSESDPVVLDNVADGKIDKDSKEAVNGSQLWKTNQKIDGVLDKAKTYTDERFNDIINHQMGDVINEAKSYTDMKFDALNYSIEGVRKEARQAAAIGIAVANLRYNETPGKLSVGFGTGLWRNKSAFAFGAGYTSESGSVLSNVSVTHSGGHWGIGAGFNVTLD